MRRDISKWVYGAAVAVLVSAGTASAQNYIGDARRVAMGGVGDDVDIAAGMVPKAEQATVIQIPLGLIPILMNFGTFNPSSDSFDPVRAIESAAGPIHYTFGRSTTGPVARFVTGVVNGELSRDLSTYRGFILPEKLAASGLTSPVFGKTIKLVRSGQGGFHGLFVGAGPYLSFDTRLAVDRRLSEILGNDTPISFPSTTLQVENRSAVQLAMAVTVGYRARFILPGAGDETRDGIYVAFNYRHLRGFRYLEPVVRVDVSTDAAGLIATDTGGSWVTVDALEATRGTGHAMDFGIDVVNGRWQAGVGVNGMGNRMTWTNFTANHFVMGTLTDNAGFAEQPQTVTFADRLVRLPVVSSGHVGYSVGAWGASTEVVNGLNGRSVSSGVERRFGPLALRGGSKYSRNRWEPTGGFGIGRRVALDVGFFGSHANLQSERRLGMALSLRINR